MEDRINKIKESREFFERTMAPKKEFISEQVHEKQSRDGLLGAIANVVIGKKTVQVTKSRLVNQEEIEEYNNYKKEKLNSYDEEIKQLDKELKSYTTNENIKMCELQRDEINRRKEQLLRKKDSVREEFNKNFEIQNKKAFKNKKAKIEEYIDEINEEFSQKIDDEIYDKKSIILDVIKSSIENNLNIKLEEKNNELLILQNKLESSQEEKKLYEERLSTMLKDIDNILSNAIEINMDLESEPVDIIEEEMI